MVIMFSLGLDVPLDLLHKLKGGFIYSNLCLSFLNMVNSLTMILVNSYV